MQIAEDSKDTQKTGWFSTRKEKRNFLSGYAFVLPFMIFYAIFTLIPIFFGVWISLHNWEIVGTNIRWVGLQNFSMLLKDDLFWTSLKNTLFFVVLSGPVLIVVGLGFALTLNRRMQGMGIFRTLFYLPNLLSVTVTGTIWQRIFAADRGFINGVIINFGFEQIAFLQDPDWALPAIAIATVWWTVGFNMLVFLAGLQNIPQDLYDAAEVDGANSRQSFRYITLPGLRRPMLFVLVLQTIGSFQVFGQVDVMTGGGPAGHTRTIVYYIYERSFDYWQLGYGSALAFILFIILFTLSIFQLKFFASQE